MNLQRPTRMESCTTARREATASAEEMPRCRRALAAMTPATTQGLTLVHFSVNLSTCLWDELGSFSDDSDETPQKVLRLS